MYEVFKGCIFGLNTAFHCRLGVWVFYLCYLACLFVYINNALACTLWNFTCQSLGYFGRDIHSVLLGDVYQPFGFRCASSSLAVISIPPSFSVQPFFKHS